jgi:short-subunit dehydrogenase
MDTNARKLAVVTGASGGIGLELALLCAQNNYDLVIAADEPSLFDAAEELAAHGVSVRPVRCDLSTLEGIDVLHRAIAACGKPADILVANAGCESLDGDLHAQLKHAHDYIDGTVYLIDQVSRSMRGRGHGRILITYSIAGLIPQSSEAVHASNQAFLGFFCAALCRELKHTGVTVTCLAPDATATSLFERGGRAAGTLGSHAVTSGMPAALKACAIPSAAALS